MFQVVRTETAKASNSECGWGLFRDIEEFGIDTEEGLGVEQAVRSSVLERKSWIPG